MNRSNLYNHWKLETDDNGVIWCHIDVKDSSANVLSSEVLDEFGGIIDSLADNPPHGLIILSDKSNGFIAGADINEFTTIETHEQALALLQRGHSVFDRLEALRCPTLSLIHGFCLGGGMELALACDYRIALDSDKTRLGLPEILLGIHPGFGGTMRLIRLIGPVQGLPLMLQGRAVDARTARRLDMVDYAVPERQFFSAAAALIEQRPPVMRAGRIASLINRTPLRRLLALYLARQVRRKANPGHYPAPYALLDLWEQYGNDEAGLLREEAGSVARLAIGDTARNLVRVYLLQERLKSFGGRKDFKARHVHVAGAGAMGGDIAAWCALQGLTVSLQDRKPEFIAPAFKRAHRLFSRKLRQPRRVRNTLDRLVPDIAASQVRRADVIIEAIVEDPRAKIDLFKQFEPELQEHTVLATNTSSISLESLSETLQQPERLTGIHFFNPVDRMQLVEIVGAENTSPEWLEQASAFCRQIGKLPLPVKSSPGFLVNRILTPYLMETMLMYEEGTSPEMIDRIAVDFGMPVGPVELADTVGLDICLSVARNLSEKIGITIPDRLIKMVERGTLGKKTGAGFYLYKNGRPQKKKFRPPDDTRQDIEDRLIMRILNECAACMREQIVKDTDLLDAGMIFGAGFSPFRGGPMQYARTIGYRTVAEKLRAMESRYGERFAADSYWLESAAG